MNFDPFDFKSALPVINEESEFFPLLSSEDEEEMNNESLPEILSILPLRNTVLFPGVVIPITVGRDKSIKLIRDANKGNRMIGVVAQTDVSIEDPSFSQLNKVGTIALIIKMLQMPDGNTRLARHIGRKLDDAHGHILYGRNHRFKLLIVLVLYFFKRIYRSFYVWYTLYLFL